MTANTYTDNFHCDKDDSIKRELHMKKEFFAKNFQLRSPETYFIIYGRWRQLERHQISELSFYIREKKFWNT